MSSPSSPTFPISSPLRIPAGETGTPAALLRDALTALGLCVDDGKGGRELDLLALAAVAAQPAAQLAPRAPALLSAVATQLSGRTTLASAWTFPAAGAPLEIAVTRDPWAVRVRSTGDAAGAPGLVLADGIAAGSTPASRCPRFPSPARPSCDSTRRNGPGQVRVARSGSRRRPGSNRSRCSRRRRPRRCATRSRARCRASCSRCP